MKTPKEIYLEAIYADMDPADKVSFEEFSEDLDAAGYHITANLPPNSAVHVTTDERGHIVQFKPHGETQESRHPEG